MAPLILLLRAGMGGAKSRDGWRTLSASAPPPTVSQQHTVFSGQRDQHSVTAGRARARASRPLSFFPRPLGSVSADIPNGRPA